MLLADGSLECINGGFQTSLHRHGQVFHLQRYITVITHHAANREEFLPPLQVTAAADSYIVPCAILGALYRQILQQAVNVNIITLRTSVLAVYIENLVAQCTSRRK